MREVSQPKASKCGRGPAPAATAWAPPAKEGSGRSPSARSLCWPGSASLPATRPRLKGSQERRPALWNLGEKSTRTWSPRPPSLTGDREESRCRGAPWGDAHLVITAAGCHTFLDVGHEGVNETRVVAHGLAPRVCGAQVPGGGHGAGGEGGRQVGGEEMQRGG